MPAIDAFLQYQFGIPNEIQCEHQRGQPWRMQRLVAANAATARSSIYGGIVDHFMLHCTKGAVKEPRHRVAVVERGLAGHLFGSSAVAARSRRRLCSTPSAFQSSLGAVARLSSFRDIWSRSSSDVRISGS